MNFCAVSTWLEPLSSLERIVCAGDDDDTMAPVPNLLVPVSAPPSLLVGNIEWSCNRRPKRSRHSYPPPSLIRRRQNNEIRKAN
jgi:hypothetical protein